MVPDLAFCKQSDTLTIRPNWEHNFEISSCTTVLKNQTIQPKINSSLSAFCTVDCSSTTHSWYPQSRGIDTLACPRKAVYTKAQSMLWVCSRLKLVAINMRKSKHHHNLPISWTRVWQPFAMPTQIRLPRHNLFWSSTTLLKTELRASNLTKLNSEEKESLWCVA